MLPDNMELQSPQTKEWPLIPEDVYQTEITDIEYKVEKNVWKEREKDPVKKATMPDEKQVITFEFTIIEEGVQYGRKLWQKMSPIKPYPPSGTMTSWLYRLASAMAGHPITRAEADKFNSSDINGYIHRQVRVTVKHNPSKDGSKTYNNVESFLAAKTELPLFDEAKVPKENQPATQNAQSVEKLTEQPKSSSEADSRVSGGTEEAKDDEPPF
jgi:hypothetical protein